MNFCRLGCISGHGQQLFADGLIHRGYFDQVWRQDGWILANKFFFCVFMERDEVEVQKLANKERGQYPAILTEQAWSIKDLLYACRENVSCGTQRVVPNGQDSSILTARVASHSARFGSSCSLTELIMQPIRMQEGPCVFHDITSNFLVRRRAYVTWIAVLAPLLCMAWYKIVFKSWKRLWLARFNRKFLGYSHIWSNPHVINAILGHYTRFWIFWGESFESRKQRLAGRLEARARRLEK